MHEECPCKACRHARTTVVCGHTSGACGSSGVHATVVGRHTSGAGAAGPALVLVCWGFCEVFGATVLKGRGVVVSHPLSMREALGSIPSVSMAVCSASCS